MEKIKIWLNDNGSGYGYGDGSGYGYGDRSGYGDGYGSGYGYGDGYGDGYGSGYGYGDGSGYGYGDGYGSGYGYGDGSGYGYGDGSGYGSGCGSGLKSFNKMIVWNVDNIPTIITHTKDSFAKGYILNSDFTLIPCVIAKGNGYFAHGNNLKEAQEALRAKIFENMDTETAITEFIGKFKKDEKYSGKEFFEWHHYLTGSCLMGRESFVKNHNINLEDTFTVDDFIDICENDYGGSVIKELKEKWRKLYA